MHGQIACPFFFKGCQKSVLYPNIPQTSDEIWVLFGSQ